MNPIQLEILKIDRRWQQEVKQHADIPLFICLGERHELNLFEAYFKYQLSDDSVNNDIFMLHYQPFEKADTYGHSLVEEWKEVFDLWQEEQDNLLHWTTDTEPHKEYKTDAYLPVFALAELCLLYPELKKKQLFLHLAPVNISDLKDFETWVKEWCIAAKDHRNIKLVYADHHAHRSLKPSVSRHEFRLQMDINQMMQHAAAYTNREKNEVESDYQQQLLIASNFLSKGQQEQGQVALERAITIAQKQGLKEAEATARLMLAQSFAAVKQKKKAHEQYHLALLAAGTDSLIGAQMHMNYGSFLLMESQKNTARTYFDDAVRIAESIENYFIAMECTRIAGQLSESKLTGTARALEYYLKCMTIGRKMSLEQRRQSSMAYVALSIKKIYGPGSREALELEAEMSELIGEDWEKLASVPDHYAHPN